MVVLFVFLLVPAMAMILWRFFKGPDTANRVLALDSLGVVGIALLALLALFYQRQIYLDVALVFGLVGFAGVVLFGRFLDRGV